ncbi:MAG: glycosyltransferase family 2 protein [Chitinophagales bacterium]|nr:glycosyltransferase family 2 protein [Chitinophagales bacterium]MCZ2393352.1 glycosyltransferase family 2 protein [Chitinophagales bacterium]
MSFSLDISVVVPLYNEEGSLPELFEWIKRVMDENQLRYEIIAVNDGSSDESWKVIEEQAIQNSNIKGICFQRNYGKSAALNEGFNAAQGEVVITMDADLQDSPDEIPALYKMIKEEGFDLVSGWKKKRLDPKLSKNIPSKFFNYVTKKISGIELNDFNCGLKAYKNEVVKSIEVYGEMHRYIPVIAKWTGFSKIGEKVVVHQERKYGVTKFGIERFINGFLDLLSITFVSKFSKRPMHLFGTLGVVSFALGFLILLYLSISKIFFSQVGITSRPLFYLGIIAIIIGAQLFLTGFLAELISRSSSDRNTYLIKKKLGI